MRFLVSISSVLTSILLQLCLPDNDLLTEAIPYGSGGGYQQYNGYCYKGKDIKGCGYIHEWNSEDGYLFNPYNVGTPNLGYTRHYRINSIGECAEICKGENAEAGEYGNDYNPRLCYCIQKAECREPDKRLKEKGGKVFSTKPKPYECPKSFCDKEYFYCSKESYCKSKGFHFKDACKDDKPYHPYPPYGDNKYNPKPVPAYKPQPTPYGDGGGGYNPPVWGPTYQAPVPVPSPYAAPYPNPVPVAYPNPVPVPYPHPVPNYVPPTPGYGGGYPVDVPPVYMYDSKTPPIYDSTTIDKPTYEMTHGNDITVSNGIAVINPMEGLDALIEVYDGPPPDYVDREVPPDELFVPVQEKKDENGLAILGQGKGKKKGKGEPRFLKNPFKGKKGELNTSRGEESNKHVEDRINGEDCPESDEPEDPNICPVDPNYLSYAKCFNEPYTKNDLYIPSDAELYEDYKAVFDYGFTLKGDVSEENNFVTNERWPGMLLRMCFHDQTVDPYFIDFQDYIDLNMVDNDSSSYNGYSHDKIERVWNGPEQFLDTSGGDASLLLCPAERFHPNNNYDQTASRTLNAFIRRDIPHLKGYSMMDKYHMSYSDFMYNGCQAATIYLTTFNRVDLNVAENIPPQPTHLQEGIERLYKDIFRYGRRDACHVDPKSKKKIALCGQSELLPGLGLNGKDYDEWFTSRGMSSCNWLTLMWTHTTMDNMALECPLKELPTDPTSIADIFVFKKYGNLDRLYFRPNKKLDYFQYFLARGIHIPDPNEPEDPEDPGCKWFVDGYRIRWPLTRTDCVISLDALERQRLFDVLKFARMITNWTKKQTTNSLFCSLQMFGGTGKNREKDCAQIIDGDPVECSLPIVGGNMDEHMFGSYLPKGFINTSGGGGGGYNGGGGGYNGGGGGYDGGGGEYNGGGGGYNGGSGGGYNYGEPPKEIYGSNSNYDDHKKDNGGYTYSVPSTSSYTSDPYAGGGSRTESFAAAQQASTSGATTKNSNSKIFYSGIVAICVTVIFGLL